MSQTLALGPIPFNIGVRDVPHNAPYPDELTFTVRFDEKLGFIAQVFDRTVAETLARVYEQGSQLGTPMNDYGLGRAMCEDFVSFLLAALGRSELAGLRVLEIGCGTGYLLSRLAALGADALGIEPGRRSSSHAERAGIPVIHEVFERTRLDGRFDVIIHTGVLEHVRAPLRFLERQLELLAPQGRIAFAVPDCEPFLAHGDLSMFVHEHWNYFTRASVTALSAAAGGRLLACRRAGVGGALYALIAAGRSGDATSGGFDAAAARAEFAAFAARVERGKEALHAYFTRRAGSAFGVYCPGRLLNYWPLTAKARPRLFDDDMALHGRYFPPIPAAVESRAQLLSRPVDCLLIMSRTFGPALAQSLRREPALSGCDIVTVGELF